MAKRQNPRRPTLVVATRAQIEAAFEALSPLEVTRFRRFAAGFWRASPVRTHAIDPEDLVLEAMKRVLEGKRRWYPGRTNFSNFFFGCVKSVVFHAIKRESKARIATPVPDADGCGSWEDDIPSDIESPEIQAIVAEKYAYVMDELTVRLGAFPKAQEVLIHRTLGHSADEIMDKLGMSANQYDALRKLIDRSVAAIEDQLTGVKKDIYGFTRRVTLDLGMTFKMSLDLASYCNPDSEWHQRFIGFMVHYTSQRDRR